MAGTKKVYFTSVTEQWAGDGDRRPMARKLLPEWRPTPLDDASFRISRSAKAMSRAFRRASSASPSPAILSYEINVPPSYGLMSGAPSEGGEKCGITPLWHRGVARAARREGLLMSARILTAPRRRAILA